MHPAIVDELAQDLTKPKCSLVTMGFAVGKHFNGMLSQRAIASLTTTLAARALRRARSVFHRLSWNIAGLEGLSGFQGRSCTGSLRAS